MSRGFATSEPAEAGCRGGLWVKLRDLRGAFGVVGRCRRAPGLAEEEALALATALLGSTRTKFNHDPTTNWRESEWRSH